MSDRASNALSALVACIQTSADDAGPAVTKGSVMAQACKTLVKTGQFADAVKALEPDKGKDAGWVSVEDLVTMGTLLCIRCLSEKGLRQTHAKVSYRGHSLCIACLVEVSKMETTIGQWDFSCVNYHRDLEAEVIKKLTPGGKANAG